MKAHCLTCEQDVDVCYDDDLLVRYEEHELVVPLRIGLPTSLRCPASNGRVLPGIEIKDG